MVDSTGHFLVEHLPPGDLRLRAFLDQNNNRVLDRTEKWDSATVSPTDSLPREFYVFEHDSVGPGIADIVPMDSVTLRLKFSRPLLPSAPLDASHFTVRRTRDSSDILVTDVHLAVAFDSHAAVRKRTKAD